ncbi:MAG: hypothetical protein U0989_14455 [Azonexus sp.]|nr:hypothetical protein [Azonexus sp.]MDZ4315957.1 hypothetical protein [Azonexus sp.]
MVSNDEHSFSCSSLLIHPESVIAIGQAARACIVARYSWEAHMSHIDRYLPMPATGQAT